jgi:hypothetical protein
MAIWTIEDESLFIIIKIMCFAALGRLQGRAVKLLLRIGSQGVSQWLALQLIVYCVSI